MKERNISLETLISEAGISRAGLAARINDLAQRAGETRRYDHTSVGRWIRGERPRGDVPDLVRAVLSRYLGRELTLDDLGFATPAPGTMPLPLATYLDRTSGRWQVLARELEIPRHPPETAVPTGIEAQVPVWEWENLPEDQAVARGGTRTIGSAEVSALVAARGRYEQMYRQVGGVATGSRVLSFLNNHTAPMLRASYSEPVGRQLLRSTGGLVAIAGICAYDSDRQRTAQTFFHQALRFAKAADDRPFGAYIMALLVSQALHTRDDRAAVAYATVGLRAAGPHISPALASDLYAQRAKAHARLHDAGNARRDITQAERAAGRIRASEEPPETGYIQPGLLETQVGTALLHLGDLEPAMTYAEAAAATATHPRGQVNRLITVTLIALARRDLDRAGNAATHMVSLAHGMESSRLRQHFRAIRTLMAPHRSSTTVRDVIDGIDTELAIPL
jgi:hypothetical protein